MNYDNLIYEFVKSFPEVEVEAREWVEYWQKKNSTLPVYLFFGDIINQHLEEELLKDNNDELLNRLFDFLERMANSDDDMVRDIIFASVFWGLDGLSSFKRAYEYMRSKTRAMYDAMAREELQKRRQ